MVKPRLSIVIPVYNEEGTLAPLLDRVLAADVGIEREMIIVDDGSTDRSAAIIDGWCARHAGEPGPAVVVQHQGNAGKGSAVRVGIARSSGSVVIVQDADLEYDPAEHGVCIEPILSGRTLVVYGSRRRSLANRSHSSLAFHVGGILVTWWMNLLYGARLTDEPTCYKAFAGDLIRALPLEGDGFEWEPEVTAKLLRLGFRIEEVPISYHPRKTTEGKKINWRDGVLALWTAWRWRFRSLARERGRLAAACPGILASSGGARDGG